MEKYPNVCLGLKKILIKAYLVFLVEKTEGGDWEGWNFGQI